METYDVIIIGSGPAGLTAGLYTARAGLRTVVLEKEHWGGLVANIDLIENYPGFSDGVRGIELTQSMMKQAMSYRVEFQLTEVTGIELNEDHKLVKTTQGNYWGKTIIVASGARPKKLGVPGEEEFKGKGVAYCALCDGDSFVNQVVAVAGGGDAGITEGLCLARLASKVIIIELMPQLTATDILQRRALANVKMEIHRGTKIKAVVGDSRVRGLELLDVRTGRVSTLEVDGLFVYIGLEPNTDYLKGILPLDDEGQILVNERLETQVPGCFAAGDVRCNSKRQVITAAGDGATAALAAQRFLMELRNE